MDVNGSLKLIAGGEVLNLRIENLGNDPVAPLVGQCWYNTATNVLKYFNGTDVKIIGTGGDITTLVNLLAGTGGAASIGILDAAGDYSGDNIEAALIQLGTEIDDLEAAAGTSTGLAGLAYGSTYAADGISLESAIAALDNAIVSNDGELTALEAVTGSSTGIAGLTYTGANYLTATNSLEAALVALDAELKTTNDAIGGSGGASLSDRLDATEAILGSTTGLAGITFVTQNYATNGDTFEQAVSALDAAAKANYDAIGTNDTDISDLEAAVGSSTGTAGLTYTGATYLTASESVQTSLLALDTAIKAADDTAAAAGLQEVYDISAANSPDGHARIKLATGKDLRIVDDTDDSVYFMVDAETGNVIITGNLTVAGSTTQVSSAVTTFTSQAINTDVAGTVGLDIRPGPAYTTVPTEALDTGNAVLTDFSGTLINGAAGVRGLTVTDSVETFTDDGAGFLVGSAGGTGTINYATGAWAVSFAAAPADTQAISAGYQYDAGTTITPTADLLAIRHDAGAAADVRVDTAGQMVLAQELQAVAGIDVTGNIIISGSVDGVEIAEFKTAYDAHVNGAASKHDATEIDYEGAPANYLTGVTEIETAVTTLDGEIKSINDAIGGSGGASLTDRLDGLEAATGTTTGLLGNDYATPAYVTADTTYIAAIGILDGALEAADSKIAALTLALGSATEAGITYGGDYVTDSTDLVSAVIALDAALKSADDEIDLNDTDISDLEAAVGSSTGVAGNDYSSVVYVTADESLVLAVGDLDAALNTHVTDLAAVTTGKGASMVSIEDANSKITATDVEGALEELADRITNSTKIYTSNAPATSHLVTHSFGQKYCNVTVIDSSDNMIIPQSVVFTNINELTVTFNSAIDCTVVAKK